ncbi:hypothetical protein CDAR_302911 [Caerostris darwini]|uniref:Uncharacterized protein n=1 Tax=Caerostris darwini TaxID=1538125 RepID=A0AAV4V499_9ARAC|nr:hypothetical protein CDAR_302911 [Caerostris darwini]
MTNFTNFHKAENGIINPGTGKTSRELLRPGALLGNGKIRAGGEAAKDQHVGVFLSGIIDPMQLLSWNKQRAWLLRHGPRERPDGKCCAV